MYALPHQSIDEACHDFSIALSLGVSHVSAYHLTMEPHTYFASNPPSGLPSDDLAADIHQAIYQTLSSGGLHRYEVSAFSSHQKHRCRHNINYWQFGDYLGIGAGAHSKISDSSQIVRRMKIKQPSSYMKASLQSQFIQSERMVVPKDLPFEFMMNALRLVDGVPKSLWLERTGIPIHVLDKSFGKACDLGLLENHMDYFKPTELGLNFLNDLLTLFMSPQG
jgi:oxygen-independent coproporphyrinogen-3 oxidase